ncbi:MAG TPA: T9SS type A sorting domain-containing protein [Bacteroidales bacterium]|nr:T9SS type A sorting domain-containing protein [Bacteroidales bacterium]
MKKLGIGLYRAMMLITSLLLLPAEAKADQNDFKIQVRNLTQPTDRTIEFDVYLLDTDGLQQFELGSVQLGFLLNSGIYTGGILSATIDNTGSGLNATQQFSAAPSITTTLAGYPGKTLIRLAGKTPPGAGGGTIISTTGDGTLLTHFVLTNTVPWVANQTPDIVFNSSTAVNPLYATRVSQYIGTTNTAMVVTPGTNALICCNPALNAAAPVAFSVTGTGSYCQGGIGLPVGLSGSEAGATYQLLKDGIPSGSPVPGTGSPLAFGNQTAGTYTVTGTLGTTTTPMTGSAVITETLPPLQPGDFTTSSPVVYKGTQGVVYTVPAVAGATTYTWTYTGSGATFSGTTNSISINFSATATSGILSVSANNSCGASVARTLAITVNSILPSDYLLQVLNLTQPTNNTIEFDLYLKDTEPSIPMQLATIQLGFLLNSGIYTGGALTTSINNTGSGLNPSQQFTAAPSVVTTLTGYPNQTLIRLAGSTPPGAGSGTIISTGGNGTLLTHFTLTSTVPWTPYSLANLTFTSSTALSPLYATRISEYIGTTNTPLEVIPGTNALVCCNPALNAGPPTAFAVIGGGAYCEGGTGLPVDLAGSQVGVSYQLFKDATATGSPVAGTGAAISFGNQTAGTYTVSGTNPAGTTPMTGSVVIAMNPLPLQPGDFTVSSSTVCQGASGVVYTVPADASVTFNWNFTGTGATLTGSGNSVSVNFSSTATSGNLSVTATNTCGTSIARTLAITVNPTPVPTIAGLTTACEGTTGVVYTTEAGMTAYQWNISTGGTVTAGGTSTDNSVTVTWSVAGSQSVSVNYNNGNCTAATPTLYPVTVNPVPAIPVASVSQQPTCALPSGTITITSPAPAAGITFSINGVDYTNTTGLFTGVAPGTYNVTVKNASDCVSPATPLTVNAVPGAPAAPTASVTAQPTCAVSTGTITVSSPAPGASIFYSINGTTYTNTTGIFSSVPSGTYSVTYKDGSGCISSPATVTVNTAPATPAAPVAVPTHPLCNETTGTITVTSPVPAAGLTYSIDGVTFTNTTGVFTGVVPGTSSVTVKNADGCVSAPTSVTVNTAPEKPAAPIASVTQQPTCDIPAGTITITSPAPAAGITFSINGVDYTNTTGLFTGVAPGTYNVTVKNAAGCVSAPTALTVNAAPETPAAPTASVTQQPTCEVATGTITLTAPAPGAGISFSINGVDYTNTSGVFTGLVPGTYNVTVKNAAGCVSAPTALTVNALPGAPEQPGLFTASATTVYQGSGNVVYTVPNDPLATSYTWTYSGSGAVITGTANSVTVNFSASATSGIISVTANNGCGSSIARTLAVTVRSLQSTDYLLQVLNMTQPTSNTIEFDVYLLDTDPSIPFELASVQLGFLLNSGIYTGGTLTAAISNAGSGLNSLQQFTALPSVEPTLAGYPGQTLIRLAGKTPPGTGNGTIISTSGYGTLLTHFILTSSVPWSNNTRPELIFNSSSALNPLYATRLSEYIGGINTGLVVTPGTNALVCCNPMLNASAPVAFNVTGSGTYCEGTPGLSVGLSGSETGASYQLYKDGFASGGTIAGTGAALNFGIQTAGTYTVTGTNLSGTTPMTGSAVLTVTLLPAQPGNFTASAAVVYQGASDVVYTVPNDPSVTYSWSYTGSGALITGSTNSVTIDFSATATSGTLSVTATNSCGTSIPRTLAVTVNSLSTTDYLLQVLNLTQPTDNTIEFDVYLLDTEPSQSFQLATIQIGLLLNSGIYTGGSLTATISNAGSGLLPLQQFTAAPSVVSTLTGYPGQSLIRLAGNTPPGAGGGTIIATSGNGTLLTHFILTSTVPWTPNSLANMAFTSSTALSPLYATRISQYVGTTNTPLVVIPGTNALVCCNPLLNAGAPAAYAVIGSGAYCEGGTGLSVDLAGSQLGVDYQLFRNGQASGVLVPGTGSSISFGNQTAGIYTVTGTNISGSTPMTGSAVITMTPLPVQPGDFTESTSAVCQNTSGVLYTVPNDPTVTYNWSYSGNGATINGSGNSVTVAFSEAATSGNLSVSATNTCGTSIPRTIQVTVNPRPAPVISGLTSVCEGTTGVVYSTEPGMTNYQWIVSPGGTITAGGTNTDNTVTVAWTTAGNQTISVNYSSGSCTAVNPTVYPVTINSLPAPAVADIVQPTCAVPNGTITVTSPLSEAGYSIDGLDYTNTSGVLTGVVPGTYSVTIRNAAGCVSAPASVTVNAAPETPAAPVASVTAQPTCAVATGTITVTSPVPAAGISYSIDGVTYTNTSGVFTGVVPGTYSVTVRNAAGCVSAPASVLIVNTDGRPGIPGDFTEVSTYMCAGNSATYAIPKNPSVSYIWDYSGEGATITGTGNSVTISFSASATSGILSVAAQNYCGISDSRNILITVRQLPGPAGLISGLTNICQGTKGVVYSVNEIPNAVHYIWTVPKGASIVDGNDTRTIVVDFSASAVSGEITVQGSKLCGTGKVSPPLYVTVNETPSTPVISLVENVLHSNTLSGNQWYLDETAIVDAEGNKYTPATNGKYFSIVTLDGCSSSRSNVIDFTLPIKEKKELAIDIWPIPNRGNFTMTLESEDKETYNITVYNPGGMKLYEKKKIIVNNSAKIPFDLGALPAGTYYIRISGPSGTYTRTIILSK